MRNLESKGISHESNTASSSDNLFTNSKLINFEDWLFQLDYAAKNNQEKAGQRRDILKAVLTSKIFPEITDLSFTSDENLNNYIEFETEDGWHRMSEHGKRTSVRPALSAASGGSFSRMTRTRNGSSTSG